MAKPFRRPRPKLSPLFFQNRTIAAGSGSSGSSDVSSVQVSIATLKTRLVALESIKALEFEE
jgi:hypothetical protein